MTAPGMTLDEARALPVSVDLPTAGRAFGMSRGKSYELAARNAFLARYAAQAAAAGA